MDVIPPGNATGNGSAGMTRQTRAVDTATEYICPGETHPISRSVHLARLAAYFPPCRECPFREETRPIPLKPSIERPAAVERPAPRRDIFVTDGVRGVYLNEITRSLADTIASAFALLLWDESPIEGHNDGIDRGARSERPTVVVGYDERPMSPSIFAGVVAGLRRMGCHVIDIGLATKPCCWFAVDHLSASGGIFVTGSGREPSWTGLDLVRQRARPVSTGKGLERIRGLVAGEPLSRPVRSSGAHRTFQAAPGYEASVLNQFLDLRPLKVACASASPLVRRTIERLFQSLANQAAPDQSSKWQLHLVELPVRVRNPVRRRDADMLRLSTAVRERGANLGILMYDDGQRVGFVDERCRHVSAAAIARLLVPTMLADRPTSVILLEEPALSALRSLVTAFGAKCEPCPPTMAEIATSMHDRDVPYAGGESGRHWFNDVFPASDALITLAKVLVAATQADVPFSELAAG